MKKQKPAKDLIIETLKIKGNLKQDVFRKTTTVFKDFKTEAQNLIKEMMLEMKDCDKEISIQFIDKDEYEFHIKFGGDILVFFMHTNVFDFEKSHHIRNTSYVKEDELRSYCGMINVYNFLSDSFKYNRINDLGYLVGRFFINKDLHYFVEGKKQLGFLYNDFINAIITKEKIKSVIESMILYTLDFDLLTPPYDNMSEVSVIDIIEVTNAMNIKTGKRLGFHFQTDNDLS